MKFFGTTISEIDDTLNKLKKITRVMNELKLRKFKLETWLVEWTHMGDTFNFKTKCQKKLAYIPKVQARLERMFQDTLAELINLDKMSDDFLFPVLDTEDQERIWDWQFDEIEKFAKNYGEE